MAITDIFVVSFAFLVFAVITLAIVSMIFWIWMIVDCAQRKFKKEDERIVWVLVVVLAGIIGALIYFLVIKNANPKGISKKK